MILGFKNMDDFLETLFGGVQNDILIKYIIPIVIAIDLAFQFVFDSVGGIWFLIFLYTIDFLTGFLKSLIVSTKIYKLKKSGEYIPPDLLDKKLVSKKFPRFLLTMSAALLILGLISMAGKFSIVYMPLFSIFYAIFVGQQIFSIIENLYEMGLVSYATYKRLIKKISEYTK